MFGFRCRRRGRWERLVEPTGHGLVATARSLALDRVAIALGYRRDATDKARWKRPGSVLSITGEKFFDHQAGTGGGGAISLVMALTQHKYRIRHRILMSRAS